MAGKMESVFLCQSCRKPLKIVQRKGVKDSTLIALQTRDSQDEARKKKEAEAVKLLGESFVVLSDTKKESNPGKSVNFHDQVQALTKIFEVVSDNCGIDCPLCDRCNYDVLRSLKEKIKDIKEETESFKKCISALEKEDREKEDCSEVERLELVQEKEYAREFEKQIQAIKRQRDKLAAETLNLEQESKKLDDFEKKFWDEYQELELEEALTQETHSSLEQRIESAKQQLEQLKCTNVYNDAFYISGEGHFASINGFKLGRLPSEQVEWDEINAALGQVVLLLTCIAKQARYDFKGVVIHPMGSYSKIADRKKPDVLNELYNYNSNEFFLRQGSSSSSAGKRFHTALHLLLRAVKELGDYASSEDPTFKLLKKIEGHKIEGISIQAVAAEVQWTKALKHLLVNLKCLLVWAAKYAATEKKR